jgi:hypothetical protein
MNYIYNYYTIYLGPKANNNFFLKPIIKPIRKAFKKEEIRHWILVSKIIVYIIFTPSFEHPPIYLKKRTTLKEC